jgi:hypothetical protein
MVLTQAFVPKGTPPKGIWKTPKDACRNRLKDTVLAYLAVSPKTSGTLVLVRPRACTIDADQALP